MRLVAIVVAVITVGCAGTPGRVQLTDAEIEAVRSAEAFVLRHGFTRHGHPPKQPVYRVGILDAFTIDEDALVAERFNTLHEEATCLVRFKSGGWAVYFKHKERDGFYAAINVNETGPVQVAHQLFRLRDDCIPVSAPDA